MDNKTDQEIIDILLGALADIAFSDDMTIEIARAKAKRIYESIRGSEDGE